VRFAASRREFDIHSAPGEGTIVMARFGSHRARYWRDQRRARRRNRCGDAWCLKQDSRGFALSRRRLGHGTFAAEAARIAVDAFDRILSRNPREIIAARERAHVEDPRRARRPARA
jgi:hypothetical protein